MLFEFSTRNLLLAILICVVFCLPVFAQGDTWIPAQPNRVVPTQLAVFSCSGQTTVNARWIFADGGFRVTQTPIISRSGNTISVDARVEEFTGGRTQAIVPFNKNFDI